MDEKQMLLTMINMQKELDKAILESKGLEWNNGKCNIKNLKLAILDEIGEFNHELKSEWCWWKDTQPEVDQERVLEELVDIWHFAMMWLYRKVETDNRYSLNSAVNRVIKDAGSYFDGELSRRMYFILSYDLHHSVFDFISSLIYIGRSMGFQIEDVYNAYIKKNKVNYERLKAGY